MIIKFSDVNVDGCGTNVDVLLEISNTLTPHRAEELLNKIKFRIYTFKKINSDWSTDDVLSDVEILLKAEKLKFRWITEYMTIEF
ncbi:MAG: hypothetical protein IJT36_01590 [Alphaproteobacteria bacterium]|nr:hypothetical protein [Alphaproteobacteria bacterium]